MAQAQKEVNLLAARQFFQNRSYSWKTDHEGFLAKRGDLVYLSHDANQFGFSGRVLSFIFDGNSVLGFKASSFIESDVSWVCVRLPNGDMNKYRCEFKDGHIYFVDSFSIEDAPYFAKDQMRDYSNGKSRFPNSYPDDYIFIADIKDTTGKIVRISSVESHEDNTFTYSAVDEDQAMWAFEIGINENPTSIDDSIGTLLVQNIEVVNKGNGKVFISWNGSDDCLFMIVDTSTNQPLEINGRFSLSEKTATLELIAGKKYNFKIVPISISSKVNSISKEFSVWPE